MLSSTLFARRLTRFVVMWAIAAVLPLQGAAVGVFTAMGPAHVHKAARAALVLEDVRRWKPAPVAQTHILTALGHFHAGDSVQRHYHPIGDTSVVHSGSEGPLDGADADGALSASALSVPALIPAVAVWSAPAGEETHMARSPWALQTGFTQPLDRPPQRA